MLAALVLAASCAAWHPQVTGHYIGTAESDGEKAIETDLVQAPDGSLAGTYTIHEPGRDVPGTLATVADESCDTTLFRWTDIYGTGLARLRFYPDRHCFEGNWGRETIMPRLFWRSCTQDRVTS